MKEKLNIFFELTKIRITSFVTITTAFGYVVATQEINSGIIAPVIGILLVACGSAVINHYQERKTDAIMDRTKNRPIPSGRISPGSALTLAMVLLIIGSVILYLGANLLAAGLALLNLIWYNGIYTPLKKVNPLAIIPGSLVGAIPPAVGWVAGGGYIFDPQILVLSFFFFIWQIPHFWLLLLVLSKDYEQAGFPTLTKLFSPDQLARITFIWIIATVVTGLLVPLFGIINNPFVFAGMFLSGIWLGWNSFKIIKHSEEKIYFRFAFREINLFVLIFVALISIDNLVIFI